VDEPRSAQTLELPSVSVVMPTYNRARSLKSVVEPLLADPFPKEIVVVVDGCRDGSIDVLERLASTDQRLKPVWIANSGEMGARQTGVETATSAVVLMLDDDVYAEPGLVANHARRHGGAENLLALGYMPTTAPEGVRSTQFATHLYAIEYENACRRYEDEPETILRYLWAGNMSMRRDDALRVGLATGNYASRYHQDREFGIRCLKAGMTAVFDRSLFAQHIHSRSLAAFRRDAQQEGLGRRLLHEIHGDLLGPMPGDEFERGLGRVLAWVVRSCDRDIAYRSVSTALNAIVRMAERLRLLEVEVNTTKLLRRIEQRRGAHFAADSG
jgi:glycosyltransferase involved in cell wall biosynthesis